MHVAVPGSKCAIIGARLSRTDETAQSCEAAREVLRKPPIRPSCPVSSKTDTREQGCTRGETPRAARTPRPNPSSTKRACARCYSALSATASPATGIQCASSTRSFKRIKARLKITNLHIAMKPRRWHTRTHTRRAPRLFVVLILRFGKC